MSVKIDSLKELSKSIPLKPSKAVRIKRDKINIITVKKYLLISSKSNFIFVKINLLMKIFLGLLNESI